MKRALAILLALLLAFPTFALAEEPNVGDGMAEQVDQIVESIEDELGGDEDVDSTSDDRGRGEPV